MLFPRKINKFLISIIFIYALLVLYFSQLIKYKISLNIKFVAVIEHSLSTGSERLFKAEIESQHGGRRFTAAPDVNRRRLMQRAKMKSLRISVVILVAFVIWWTPYYVTMIYFMFTDENENPPSDVSSNLVYFFALF